MAVLDGKVLFFHGKTRSSADSHLAVLPKGSRLVLAERSGVSTWSKTGKLSIVLADGRKKRYFIKVMFLAVCFLPTCIFTR